MSSPLGWHEPQGKHTPRIPTPRRPENLLLPDGDGGFPLIRMQISPASPTLPHLLQKGKKKEISLSYRFPEMAQTYEQGAKNGEQPFRNRTGGGTGLRQGKLNMKEVVKPRRERADACKPRTRLQAGRGGGGGAGTRVQAHADTRMTRPQSWPILNVGAQSFKRKIPSHTANQNC